SVEIAGQEHVASGVDGHSITIHRSLVTAVSNPLRPLMDSISREFHQKHSLPVSRETASAKIHIGLKKSAHNHRIVPGIHRDATPFVTPTSAATETLGPKAGARCREFHHKNIEAPGGDERTAAKIQTHWK